MKMVRLETFRATALSAVLSRVAASVGEPFANLSLRRIRRRFSLPLKAAIGRVAVAGSAFLAFHSSMVAEEKRTHVVMVTNLGHDLSDAFALAYVVAHPAIELESVKMAGENPAGSLRILNRFCWLVGADPGTPFVIAGKERASPPDSDGLFQFGLRPSRRPPAKMPRTGDSPHVLTPVDLGAPTTAEAHRMSEESLERLFATGTPLADALRSLYELADRERPSLDGARKIATAAGIDFSGDEFIRLIGAHTAHNEVPDRVLKPLCNVSEPVELGGFPNRVHVIENYQTDIEERWWLSGRVIQSDNINRYCRGMGILLVLATCLAASKNADRFSRIRDTLLILTLWVGAMTLQAEVLPIEVAPVTKFPYVEQGRTDLWVPTVPWMLNRKPVPATAFGDALVWSIAETPRRWLETGNLPLSDFASSDALEMTLAVREKAEGKLRIRLYSPHDQGNHGPHAHWYRDVPLATTGDISLRLWLTDEWTAWGKPVSWSTIKRMGIEYIGDDQPTLNVKSISLVDWTDPDEHLLQEQGIRVWDAPNLNRRQMSGHIFHVLHQEGQATQVRLRWRSHGMLGQLRDGRPANFALRVFGPNDRLLWAEEVGRPDRDWYETTINLSKQPAGRYRIATYGWHGGFTVVSKPAQPIGVIGASTAGLNGGSHYFWIPEDTEEVTVSAGAVGPQPPVLRLMEPDGKLVQEGQVEHHHSKNATWTLTEPAPGAWRVVFSSEAPVRLNIRGVPGLLWPTAEAATAAQGDLREHGGRSLAHRWQEPLWDWLRSRTSEDFAVPVKALSPLPLDRMPRATLLKLTSLGSRNDTMANGMSLVYDHQITDPEHPAVGLFADEANPASSLILDAEGKNAWHQIGYAHALAALATQSLDGYNPLAGLPGMRHRAWAAAIQILLMVPEHQAVTMDFVRIRMLGHMGRMLLPGMPPSLAEPFRAGLIENMGRDAYFDGHTSNQGLNVMVGLLAAADACDDPLMRDFFDRYMAAFFADQFSGMNHGQVSAGFYQENGGFDGAYSTYTAALLLSLWHDTQDPRFAESLNRYYEFLRHVTVTQPDGQLTSARQWNTRTDSNAFRWHIQRAGASLPSAATFLSRYEDDKPYLRNVAKARQILASHWSRPAEKELNSQKWWMGFFGDHYQHAGPWSPGRRLACEEEGSFIREFGPTYQFAREGPWYLVLYGGDTWDTGDAGSGLATLWHRNTGPILVGDTRNHRDKTPSSTGPDSFRVFADGWQKGEGRQTTHKAKISFTGTSLAKGLTANIRPKGSQSFFRRGYQVVGEALKSTAEADESAQRYELHLPLVHYKGVSIKALDREGVSVPMSESSGVIQGIRWFVDEKPRLELLFTRPVRFIPYAKDTIGSHALTMIRCESDEAPANFTISPLP